MNFHILYVVDTPTGTKDTKVASEEATCEFLERENNWKPCAWHSGYTLVVMILVDSHDSQGCKETYMRKSAHYSSRLYTSSRSIF